MPQTNIPQRGQVLVPGLLILAALCVATVAFTARGVLISEKTRIVTAADSAALAAATWRARVLNFAAYSNRALIAQEVAIAQAVTLAAWSRHFDRLVDRVQRLQPLPPALEPLLGESVAADARGAREAAELALAAELWLRATPESGYKSQLSTSQELLMRSASVFGSGAVANEVARASDPRLFAFALSDQRGFEDFTELQSGRSDRQRFADLVVESLDRFVVGPRSGNLRVVLRETCGLGAASLQHFEIRKRGATRLSEDLDAWVAVDTASLHAESGRGDEPSVQTELDCASRERDVLAWGTAGAFGGDPSLLQDPGSGVWDANLDNPRARRLAMNALAADRAAAFAGYDGIATVRDLSEQQRELGRPVRSPVAVLARLEAGELSSRVLAHRLLGDRPLDVPGGRIWGLSAGEVYFRHPSIGEGDRELASLHSPYWQARLAIVTDELREQAERYAR